MNEYQMQWLRSRGQDPSTWPGPESMIPKSPEDSANRQNRGSAWQAEGVVTFLIEKNVSAAETNVKNYARGSGLGRSTITKLLALDVVSDMNGTLNNVSEENLLEAQKILRKIQE